MTASALAAVLASLLVAPAAPVAPPDVPAPPPPPPAAHVALSKAPERPLLSNPQLSSDGSHLFIARSALPPGNLTSQTTVEVYALKAGRATQTQTLTLPTPTLGNRVRLLLAPNERSLAVLANGELWVRKLDPTAKDGGPDEARRLYPPPDGNAPLGPKLSHAALASDSTWVLVQSPEGWGRIALATGEYAPVNLHKIDLDPDTQGGSLALSPDGTHVALVKPQVGQGFLNGAAVLAINVETGFAQALDREHLYTEVFFLPDGTPLGKDVDGALWVLQAGGRLAFFTPPRLPTGASVGSYAFSLNQGWLSYILTQTQGRQPKAELWVAGAPPAPRPATKRGLGNPLSGGNEAPAP